MYEGGHVLVPFAMEDGGRLGAHAHAFLTNFARRVVQESRQSLPWRLDSTRELTKGDAATQVSLLVHRLQTGLST